jgi:two-component system chemotaxis response regulator CheB
MIKVLIVEDSAVIQQQLRHILECDPDLQVIGVVSNGQQALDFVAREKPDVITMDNHMPHMDGLEGTRLIMATNPIPIVIVSASYTPRDIQRSFQVIEAGALSILAKPPAASHPQYEALSRELVQTVKLMSEVRLVKRRRAHSADTPPPVQPTAAELPGTTQAASKIELIAIGASTGGPKVLQQILSKLPKDFQIPIVITQHIAAGFTQGLVEWLSETCALSIGLACHGEPLLPSHVYIAPNDFQMGVTPGKTIILRKAPPEHNLRPSVSFLFRSVTAALGKHAMGILLTGMGKDGAAAMQEMHDNGLLTIAQDKLSSTIHGMPGEAIRLGGVSLILAPEAIANHLCALNQKQIDKSN